MFLFLKLRIPESYGDNMCNEKQIWIIIYHNYINIIEALRLLALIPFILMLAVSLLQISLYH